MIDSIRDYVSALFRHIGRYLMLMIEAFRSPIYDGPTYRQNLARQMMRVGVESLPIVAVAAAFTGGVTTEQTIYQMRYPLIPESTVGAIVVPSIILEFGALITAFILAGRVSARIAAELGSMRTGGQIDALDVMSIRASGCLILPRVLVEATGAFSEARHVLGDSGTGVQRLVANLRSASADVEAFVEGEQSRMRSTISHLEQTSASLNTLADDLQTVVSGNQDTLGQAVQDAERTLHHTRRTARSPERSAEDLAAILSGLREGRGTAGRLLNDPRLYRRADTLALRLNRLLKDVEENPGHYVSLEVF